MNLKELLNLYLFEIVTSLGKAEAKMDRGMQTIVRYSLFMVAPIKIFFSCVYCSNSDLDRPQMSKKSTSVYSLTFF